MLGSVWTWIELVAGNEDQTWSVDRVLHVELLTYVVSAIALFLFYVYSPDTTFMYGAIPINSTLVAFPIWICVWMGFREFGEFIGYGTAWLDHKLQSWCGASPYVVYVKLLLTAVP